MTRRADPRFGRDRPAHRLGNIVGGVGALLVPITVELLGWGPALVTASLFAFVAAGLWIFIRADRVVEVAS